MILIDEMRDNASTKESTATPDSKRHWVVKRFASKMIELVLLNPEQKDPLRRVWKVSRETDYDWICLQ
jgi:hypothetical protein